MTLALDDDDDADSLTSDDMPIGDAWLEDDGSIVMRLRAEGPGGMVGDAMITIAPDNPRYQDILDHLGPLERGETVEVMPFS